MKKRITCSLMALALAISCPLTALAGPGTTQAENASPYDAETQARIQDNKLEYGELAILVHEYNPAIQSVMSGLNTSMEKYGFMANEYRTQQGDLTAQRKELEKTLKKVPANTPAAMELMQVIAALKIQESTLRSAAKGMEDVVGKMQGKTAMTKGIREVEDQMTFTCQQLMIGYSAMEANMAVLEKSKELYTAIYDMTVRQQQLDMATQANVLAAQKDVLAAESQLAAMKSQQDSVRRNLNIMTGWNADDNPKILPVPSFDLTRLEAMNLEEDTKTAIANNFSLFALHKQPSDHTTTGIQMHLQEIDEMEQKVGMKLQELYQDVQKKKAEYDAALTGEENARLSMEAAGRQFQQGMLGKAQYLGSQISSLAKNGAKASAELSLLQAMETYDWAVKGLVTLD